MKTRKNAQKFFVLLLSVVIAIGIISAPVSVYATAIGTTYSITYHLDGGTNALKNPDVYTAQDTITLKPATKVGYNFVAWYSDPDKTQQITEISGSGDIDVYAKFVGKFYNVSFNENGAEECGYKVTLKNDKTGEEKYVYLNSGESFVPHNYWKPEAPGYIYAGWMYESEVLSNTVTIDSDVVLVPKWLNNSNNYPVVGDDATGISASVYLSGERFSDTKRFYTSYEYKTYSYSYCVQKGVGTNANSTIRIVRASSVCKIGRVGDSNTIAHLSSNYTSQNDYIGINSKAGSGSFDANPGELLYVHAGASGDLGLYPLNNVYIRVLPETKRTNFGRITADNTVEFGGSFNAPTAYKNGYKFLGWYDAQGNLMSDTWQYTEAQTFTAKWEPLSYNIDYELDGGVNNAANPTIYTIEDTIALEKPTKPGYTFEGWYSDANFTTQVTSISKATGNITLYAKWAINSYNLTLNANEGGFAPKVTFISDGVEIKSCYLFEQDKLTAYRPTDKKGYIFAGWYTDDTFTSLFKFNGTISNDTTLYAKWIECAGNTISIETENKLSVSINGQNEKQYAFVPLVDGCITVTSESNNLDMYGILYNSNYSGLTYNDDISNTDLDFTYTYDVKAGKLYYITVKGVTASTVGNAVINIAWTGDCTVTGTTYQNSQHTIVYGTKYTLPQKLVREGYMFVGWFDENDTQITEGTWNFVTDKNLTAKWEKATYHTVVFKDIEGNIISRETYYLTEDIIPPALPTKASDNIYSYHAKWNNNYTGVCTGNAVYSPVFDSKYIEYDVVFVNADGTEISKATYHWGDVVTAPVTPTKAPDANYANIYTFAGWDNKVVNCAGNTIYTATYTAVPLKEVVLIAQPEKVRYYISETLDLTGLKLQCVYANDTNIFLDNVDARFVSADLSTSGKKTVTVTLAGKSVEFEIYVHDAESMLVTVDPSLYPQSTHNYDCNLDETKTFTYPGAQSLVIKFHSRTEVESDYDYIYIYDGSGKAIAKYTGTSAANKTLTIPGDTFKVRLVSDGIFSYWGYAFSTIKAEVKDPDKLIHVPVTDPTTVTCTKAGLTEGTHCDICGDILVAQKEVDALGHNYDADFNWTNDHTACTAILTCTRGCGDKQTIACSITNSDPNKETTQHTATAKYDGQVFTDTLTCGNYLISFVDWDGDEISSAYYHTNDAVIVPAAPTRAADDTYTYEFAGWDKEVTNCTGNTTYTAKYDSTYIDYTVTFKNWNGTILSTKTYHYGDKVTAPANPTKAADNTYTYAFSGWDKEVVTCAGNATYTATYTPTYIDYTVAFKNWNGDVLSTKTYHYGEKVVTPKNPTRVADNTYTYTFAGWDKNVVNCAGNTTYTATFTSTYIDYTVTFKNWDGKILSTKTYHYGDKVTTPNTPTKNADNTYTYAFAGWDKALENCKGNITYTATYTPVYIDYTVVFKDWNGDVISSKTYHYGESVKLPIEPARENDNYYTYTFAGWDKEVVGCCGNAEYEATYTATHYHTISEWIIDIAATENTSGEMHKECTECGELLETAIVPQLKPNAPKLASVVNTTIGAKVTWGAVDGADGYNVYRKTYNAKTKAWSGWSRLAVGVTSTSYLDKTAKSGIYYRYTVIATNESGNSRYDITGVKTYFLTTPTVKTSNSNSGITVKWSKVAGASGYIVYRKTTGGWTKVATVKGNSSVSYNDKTAKAGATYRYTVRAYYSSYLSYYNTKGVAVRRLTTPTLRSVTSAKTGVTLKWGKVTGATGYIVYRKTGNGGWQKIATVNGNAKVSYLDKTAKKGTTYKYTVRAYYGTSISYYNTKGLAIKDRY